MKNLQKKNEVFQKGTKIKEINKKSEINEVSQRENDSSKIIDDDDGWSRFRKFEQKKIMIKRKLKIKIKAKIIQILNFQGENKMIIKKQIKKIKII